MNQKDYSNTFAGLCILVGIIFVLAWPVLGVFAVAPAWPFVVAGGALLLMGLAAAS